MPVRERDSGSEKESLIRNYDALRSITGGLGRRTRTDSAPPRDFLLPHPPLVEREVAAAGPPVLARRSRSQQLEADRAQEHRLLDKLHFEHRSRAPSTRRRAVCMQRFSHDI